MGNADACGLNSMSVKREEERKISTDSELRKNVELYSQRRYLNISKKAIKCQNYHLY